MQVNATDAPASPVGGGGMIARSHLWMRAVCPISGPRHSAGGG
jgi:hypothetical protein